MRETESYYTSLSEIKWFACHFPNRNVPSTWQISSSNRCGLTTNWDASLSESTPAYEKPLMRLPQAFTLALN